MAFSHCGRVVAAVALYSCCVFHAESARMHVDSERLHSSDTDVGTAALNGSTSCGHTPGKYKALLVGFKYVGDGQLSGTCYDLYNMVRFVHSQGYEQIRYFTDECHDGEVNIGSEIWNDARVMQIGSGKVTKKKMRSAIHWLTDEACAGDNLFFHYTGHGLFIQYDRSDRAKGKDECNGKDEALSLPVKYQKKWDTATYHFEKFYKDDELFVDLASRVPVGAHLFAIVDACHSGTVFDLPWNWMSQRYAYTCENDEEQRQANANQFVWEWADTPAKLGRPYPLSGTVTLITGSQNTQTSGDAGMGRVMDRFGKQQKVGGLMTYRLILAVQDEPNTPILGNALEQQWSWAKMMSTLVKEVAGNEFLVTDKNSQIPNFCASERLDMSQPFTLDGAAFEHAAPPATKKAEMSCDDLKWLSRSKKGKEKSSGCTD